MSPDSVTHLLGPYFHLCSVGTGASEVTFFIVCGVKENMAQAHWWGSAFPLLSILAIYCFPAASSDIPILTPAARTSDSPKPCNNHRQVSLVQPRGCTRGYSHSQGNACDNPSLCPEFVSCGLKVTMYSVWVGFCRSDYSNKCCYLMTSYHVAVFMSNTVSARLS